MIEDSNLEELLIERHGLALAVSRGLAALHDATIAAVRSRVDQGPAWAALRELMERHQARSNSFKSKNEGLPGHWWDAMPENPHGRDTYVAGVWAYVRDVDDTLGLGCQFKMYQGLSGLAGPEFRSRIPTDWLPSGDHGEWISRGIISWSRAVPSTGKTDVALGATIEDCVSQCEKYLEFAHRITTRVIQERQP